MKKLLRCSIILLALLCLVLTSCKSKECEHNFDDNGKCVLCDYVDETKKNPSEGNDIPSNTDTFSVTFDSNGGSQVQSQSVKKGEKALQPEAPVKEGYTFDGWYLHDEKWSFIGYVVTEHMTLTAKWIPNDYTVTFDSNGGSQVQSQSVKKGEKALQPEAPVKEGYTFDGWYLNDEKWSFIGYVVTEHMTLTAKWIPNYYTVTIYKYDGTSTEISVPYGSKLPTLEHDNRQGYTFDGYYYNENLWNIDSDVVLGNVSLTEQWSAKTYTVTYYLSDSINSSSNPTFFTAADLPIVLQEPFKDGYTFVGWLDVDSGTFRDTLRSCEDYHLEAVFEVIDPNPWNTTTLIYELTENSNMQEFASTCRRYLAGDTSKLVGENVGRIDIFVQERNVMALQHANVKVKYAYLNDTSQYSWGQNIDRINQQVLSGASNAPDIYCNFVYDMVAASLKSSFANLLSTTMKSEGQGGAILTGSDYNFFAFENEINMEDDGKDYMINYMRSLSLSKYKMYCLASDYYIDTMRAFMVIPVNIELLESIKLPENDTGDLFNSDRAKKNGDKGQDGRFTIEDFYQLVWDMDWTYETLAAFSGAIYSDDNTAIDGKDISDTLGFALATSSGLSASGMLYSSSVTIIECDKTAVATKGDYAYSYPGTTQTIENGKVIGYEMATGGQHKELETFCDAITKLFKADGVLAISDIEEDTHGIAPTALQSIRKRFSTGNILFGGVICLGSLEYDEYKDMNDDGKKGYGIAPIPLYAKTGDAGKDLYQTQIHNFGRVGAISYTTKKFAQCSAYLDYLSRHSNEILIEYYESKFQYEVVNSEVQGNVQMLEYIRGNVRSSFDKAYEDALGIFYAESTGGDVQKQIWHYMIKDSGYDFDSADMRKAYESYAPIKAKRLYDLQYSTFPGLPA